MPTTDREILATLAGLKVRDRVQIQWIDAHNLANDGWFTLADITDDEVMCRVCTLGYFLCVKQDFVVLAGDAQLPEDGIREEFHSASAIPLGCIESVTVFADE
jgi:hypothetical protein